MLVSGGDDGTVRIWNTDTGKRLRTFAPKLKWVNTGAITDAHGRGLVAAAGSDHMVRVWDITTGAPTQALSGHSAAVTGLAFLHLEDRAVLASCSYDGTIKTWDVEAGRVLHSWPAQDDWPTALAAASAAEGTVLVSEGATGAVRVWDSHGTPRQVLAAYRGRVHALALTTSRDTTTAAVGGLDGSLTLWDVESPTSTSDGKRAAPTPGNHGRSSRSRATRTAMATFAPTSAGIYAANPSQSAPGRHPPAPSPAGPSPVPKR
ncbi:hypothetical protein ACIPW5_37820 [Streptomyces sp. NPDC090077]|uniref:hypothetical protein n=1 Tax=Streptomyces sp. NPDC090077 TaxID=3365938 RepID=UPI00381B16CA